MFYEGIVVFNVLQSLTCGDYFHFIAMEWWEGGVVGHEGFDT